MEPEKRERVMTERDWLLRRRESKRVVIALVLGLLVLLTSIARFVVDWIKPG